MDKKTTPQVFSFKILFVTAVMAFSILTEGKLTAQTTTAFRKNFDQAMFDLPGNIVEGLTANNYVLAGTNMNFLPIYGTVAQLNDTGGVVWSNRYSDASIGFQLNDIKKDVANSQYYVCGGSESNSAVFMTLDATGNILISKKFNISEANSAWFNRVTKVSDGGYVAVGYVTGYDPDGAGPEIKYVPINYTDANGDPQTEYIGSPLIVKLDASGNHVWHKVFRYYTAATKNAATERIYNDASFTDVVEVSDGYIAVGSYDVNQHLSATNSDGDDATPTDALMLKTTTAGAITYHKQIDNPSTSTGQSSKYLGAINVTSTGVPIIGGSDNGAELILKLVAAGGFSNTFSRKFTYSSFFGTPDPVDVSQIYEVNGGTDLITMSMYIKPLSFVFSNAIHRVNSTATSNVWAKRYDFNLISILPRGGKVSDNGYISLSMTAGGTNYDYHVIKTDPTGDTPASGCPAVAFTPTAAAGPGTFADPYYNVWSGTPGSDAITISKTALTLTPSYVCTKVACIPPAAATTVTATPNPICAGQTTVITASGPATGVTYNVYAAASGGSSLGSTPYTTPALSGNTTYYIETANNSDPTCVSTTRTIVNVTVNPSPTATAGSNSPVCVGATLNLTSGGGGTYAWAGPNTFSDATQNPSIASVTTAASGTYTVTVTASGCTDTATVIVVVNSSITPVTGFSYTTPVCANGTNPVPIPAGGFTTGGTYSSTAGLTINSSTGVIDLTTSTVGTYTVTYAVTASGCTLAGSSTTSITIDPVITPVTGFSYTSPVCANGTNPTPIPVGGFTTGGTYSSTAGLTINASTGVIDLTTSTAGTYTVTYTLAASGCTLAGSGTASITIDPTTTPVTSFSYTSPVCANGTNPVPTPGGGFTTGGTYSSTAGLTINASTGVITLSSSTPGTYTVTYTVAASGCQISGSGTASITIDPTTAPVTNFSYTTPVCANGTNPTPIPGGGFTTGGTYSSTAGLTINASTGDITLSSSTPGTYTVTYTVAATGCQTSGSGTANITIDPTTTPVTNFSYTSPVCANGTNPVPVPTGGFTTGGIYSSTAGLTINASTGVIDLATSTPGTYTVTYDVAATTCGPAGSSTASITIDPTITPVTGFSYTTPVCVNGTNPVPVPAGGFTTGGVYSSTSGLTINASTGVITLSSSTPGTYTVTYTLAASGCTSAGSNTASITITPLTTPVTGFSYTTPVCINGTNPVPIPVTSFVTGGTYSSTAGLTINASTGVITLSSSTAGTYTVTYSVAAAGCVLAGSSTATITISPVISPVTGFSYTTPVCISGTNPTPATVVNFTSGGVYSSTAGLSINATTGVIDLSSSTSGTYTVTYTYSATGCTLAGSSTTTITIEPVPVASGGPDVTITQYTQDTLSATGGGTYQWSPSEGLSCDTCANPIANPSSTTIYCVTVTNASGCSDSACVTVTVDIICGDLFVPTAFSPNGDGQNDMLYVKSNCIRDLEFVIFDRWGEKVFETNDVTIGWDGTLKGKPLDTAVFAYYLKGTIKGTIIDLHGNITLTK